jgi:hypothetical protein
MSERAPSQATVTRGHCLCGAVRYEFTGAAAWRGHCHCESCRRNCAAPFTTFFGVPRTAFRWTGADPAIYESSPGVRRPFCGTCGTPMAYDAEKDGANIHLYAASLEDSSGFQPDFHVHWAERVPWVELADDLEKYPHSGG